jgi:hypothetical protein
VDDDPHRPHGPAPRRYDPWRDLRENWPALHVVIEPMAGQLLGWLHHPVIALRAGTTAAQRRCTLAHEIIHLERGVTDCGPWSAREELLVHSVAARRLIAIGDLACAIGEAGGTHDYAGLAQTLEVDLETLQVRLQRLTSAERRVIASRLSDLWSVA